MSTSQCLILVLLRPFSAVCLRPCVPQGQSPLTIPIRNVTVESPTIRRGVALSVGTPSQDISFEISPWVNNTYIFDQSGQCDASSPPIQCAGFRGSAFDEDNSSSWVQIDLNDYVPEDQDLVNYPAINDTQEVSGQDTIRLTSSVSLLDFPFRIPRFDWTGEASMIGLGSQSTFLSGLQNAGIITSRTWAYWWGLTGLEQEMEGEVVFGGYDKAKTKGQNYTNNLNPYVASCPTKILATISDITMTLSDGTEQSILGTSHGSALRMCVDPSYPLITVPSDIWEAFSSSAGGTQLGRSLGINLFGMLYSSQDIYTGSIVFTIDGALKITIPNSQLIQPDIGYDVSGNMVYHNSNREVMLNSLEGINADDQPKLGHTFLSAAYLMVDQESNTYTLWEANPTTNQQLVSLASLTSCNASATNTAEPTSSSSSSNAPVSKPGHNTNVGAIAGGTIGGSAAIVLVITALFYFRRKRKTKAIVRQSDTDLTVILSGQSNVHDRIPSYIKPELPANYQNNHDSTRPDATFSGASPVFEMS